METGSIEVGNKADETKILTIPTCFTAVIDKYGWRIAKVEWRVKGYTPLAWKTFENEKEARAEAQKMNDELGISEKQAFTIVGSSMWPNGNWELEE